MKTANAIGKDEMIAPPPTTAVPATIKTPINIDDTFYSELNSNILRGSKNQNEQLSVIQSKIIMFSLAIVESIQKVQFVVKMKSNQSHNRNENKSAPSKYYRHIGNTQSQK